MFLACRSSRMHDRLLSWWKLRCQHMQNVMAQTAVCKILSCDGDDLHNFESCQYRDGTHASCALSGTQKSEICGTCTDCIQALLPNVHNEETYQHL